MDVNHYSYFEFLTKIKAYSQSFNLFHRRLHFFLYILFILIITKKINIFSFFFTLDNPRLYILAYSHCIICLSQTVNKYIAFSWHLSKGVLTMWTYYPLLDISDLPQLFLTLLRYAHRGVQGEQLHTLHTIVTI